MKTVQSMWYSEIAIFNSNIPFYSSLQCNNLLEFTRVYTSINTILYTLRFPKANEGEKKTTTMNSEEKTWKKRGREWKKKEKIEEKPQP